MKDVDKVSHDHREDCNSEQDDQCAEETLGVAPRVEVAEPHRRQRGEGEVSRDQGDPARGRVTHTKRQLEQI